jgi:glyoxylase-like metal-dependent hydrolase (beta-lactamase superfamily II)
LTNCLFERHSTLITRRAALAGAAGLALSVSMPRPLAIAQAQTAVQKFSVGTFEVSIVSDGTLSFPVSFALPGREAKEVEGLFASAGLPVDGITAQVNVAIVKTPDALILIDAGGGSEFMPTVGKLADALEAAGFAQEAFTHVIFTHAHADHLWGVIDPLDGGTRFTKARHIVSSAEFAYWSKPGREADVPDAFKTMAVGTARRLKTIADRIEQILPDSEIVSGVQIINTTGHTPGHVSVLLQSGGEQLLVGGDVLTHSLVSFANPHWRWGSDMDGEAAIGTRLKCLDRLASEKLMLLGYHLPWPGLGRVERKNTAFQFTPV